MIIPFHTTVHVDLAAAGGKGLNLVQMTAAGMNVPEGFILSTEAFQLFIDHNRLSDPVQAILKDLDAHDSNGLEEASAAIQRLIQDAVIPEAVSSQVSAQYRALPSARVAVRSSASAEDLPETSFAGQHNSYLHIGQEEALLQAVKDCWGSLWNPRAIAYRFNNGIPQTFPTLSMAVVVQCMAEGDAAGVMFTANPLNNRRDQLFINASWGMGEAVVSGMVTPDQFILEKQSGNPVSSRIATETVQVMPNDDGHDTVPVPSHLQDKASLTDDQLRELHELAAAVEQYYQKPMDTEWVLGRDGTVRIVQARPLTGLHPLVETNDPPEEGLRFYFSFTRVSQGISVPFTPLGIDVQRLEMWGALKVLGIRAGKSPKGFKTAEGRIYWDFTELIRNKKRATKMADSLAMKDPVAGELIKAFIRENEEELTAKRDRLKLPPRLFVLMIRMGIRVAGAMLRPEQAEKRAVKLAEDHLRRMTRQADKARTIRDEIAVVDTIMENAMRVIVHQCAYIVPGMLAEKRAEKRLKKLTGDTRLLLPVIKALPNSPTTQMGHRLVTLAREYERNGQLPDQNDPAIQSFLGEFGHRSNVELDVGIPNWQEDPAYILNLIHTYMTQDTEALYDRLAQRETESDQAVEAISRLVKEKKGRHAAAQIEQDCRYIRNLLGLRERPKFDLIRSFALVRKLLLEAGDELVEQGVIAHRDEIAFLHRREILNPEGSYSEQIAKRKAQFEHQQSIRTVPRFMTNTGETIYGSEPVGEEDHVLTGFPIASGVCTGTVRVIHDPKGAALSDGEILVTHSTDPSWTPLFLSAGGLIMETGGTGSHGGIVAREYGIPAVAGIERISEKLATGDQVRIDGNTGQIVIVKKAGSADEEAPLIHGKDELA
ncbi:PEP/pyruvate-binding domain-containing protein [Salisediminibacterium selenitireducens]|uniref:Pyruvate phosphate dikinase PEP/pyruvate-binding protein n=1 Tax=Bacillus selenitireducens (strain ATCC 700615 / DSM 15326 / MLS10) TaxID=439292 RepID=D6XXT4_BACIE|nr:PEP/pyruvate-binding domain-containing protein [Salisediminibacterium selenitireducens]ADI00127.1 pyruvate phosphate dikinase PEP/pyruvate-binding protein [[Bacillus] selenitireducens MLS10]